MELTDCLHFPKVQEWKLLVILLPRTGKNSGGQVNILGSFPNERLKFWQCTLFHLSSRQGHTKIAVDR